MGKRKGNVFWGVLLLLSAAAVLVNRLGYLQGIGFWSILFNAGLKGIARGNIGTILFSIAFLVIINDEFLHLEAITPGPVLLAALLGTVGLNMLFPKSGRRRRGHLVLIGDGRGGMADAGSREGPMISYENVFGSSVKYVSEEILQVDVENVFGSTQVYFTDALLRDGSADVNVSSVFGNVTLYLPASWKVLMDTENCFAGTQESGRCCPDGKNVLRIGGSVVFGSLEVVYV